MPFIFYFIEHTHCGGQFLKYFCFGTRCVLLEAKWTEKIQSLTDDESRYVTPSQWRMLDEDETAVLKSQTPSHCWSVELPVGYIDVFVALRCESI